MAPNYNLSPCLIMRYLEFNGAESEAEKYSGILTKTETVFFLSFFFIAAVIQTCSTISRGKCKCCLLNAQRTGMPLVGCRPACVLLACVGFGQETRANAPSPTSNGCQAPLNVMGWLESGGRWREEEGKGEGGRTRKAGGNGEG